MAIINLSIVEKNVSRNDDIITCLSVLVSKIVKKPRSAGFGDLLLHIKIRVVRTSIFIEGWHYALSFFNLFYEYFGHIASGCSYTTNSFLFSHHM